MMKSSCSRRSRKVPEEGVRNNLLGRVDPRRLGVGVVRRLDCGRNQRDEQRRCKPCYLKWFQRVQF